MAARKAGPTAAQVERNGRTVTEVEGIAKGDPVKVKGERGLFRFCYATLDGDGTPESYTVYGGLSGRGAMRAFRPERVTIDQKTKRLRRDA